MLNIVWKLSRQKKKQNYHINSWILKQKSMEKAFLIWLWCFRKLRFTNVSSLQYGDQQIIRHFNFFSIKNKINTIRIQMDQLVGDMYSGVFQRNQTHFAIISRHLLFISWYKRTFLRIWTTKIIYLVWSMAYALANTHKFNMLLYQIGEAERRWCDIAFG